MRRILGLPLLACCLISLQVVNVFAESCRKAIAPASTFEVIQEGNLTTRTAVSEHFLSLNKVKRKIWSHFDASKEAAFIRELQRFRDGADLGFNPLMHGSEGQIFLSASRPGLCMKRFFSRVSNPWIGVSYLEQARLQVEADPKFDRYISIVKVHERGLDWIIRDFDTTSRPLRDVLQYVPDAALARKELIKNLSGTRDPLMIKILKKLTRDPISENLHWSPISRKILLIDITAIQFLKAKAATTA
jgi:hypothetical protein